MVFPFGHPFSQPDDRLEQTVVKSMLAPGAIRDRITAHTYIGKDDRDPAFIVESAFLQVIATRDTRKAIKAAVKDGSLEDSNDPEALARAATGAGLCSQSEADAFIAAEKARNKAIQVDDFPP